MLTEVAEGRAGAEDRLFVRVYDELRAIAASRLRDERAFGGDPEDLVHDAYARVGGESMANRRQLFFVYARAMRQILIDRARRYRAHKRGGGKVESIGNADGFASPESRMQDPIEVERLLVRLRKESERMADVTELRCFGGLADSAIAAILGVSERTVRNAWARARERMREWLG